MIAKYVRLFSDSDGESHFEDVETPLVAQAFAASSPDMELSQLMLAVHSAFIAAPAGWNGDWHVASARNLFVVISGEWKIEASDGEQRSFGPTHVLLTEDTTGKGHRSRVSSEDGSVALLVELVEE